MFSISIDESGAGPRQDLQNPLGVRGLELHGWFFHTEVFKKMHGESGGTSGIDNDFAVQSLENVGAWILTIQDSDLLTSLRQTRAKLPP